MRIGHSKNNDIRPTSITWYPQCFAATCPRVVFPSPGGPQSKSICNYWEPHAVEHRTGGKKLRTQLTNGVRKIQLTLSHWMKILKYENKWTSPFFNSMMSPKLFSYVTLNY